jgi:uncharacterized protein with FMN-binding domain
MRRAVLTLSGTVAGLAALFSFKTHVPGAAPVAEPSMPAGLSVSAPASPAASAAGSASAAPSASASAKKTAKASPTPTAPTAPATTRPATPAKTTAAATHPAKAPSSSAPPKAPPSTAPAKPSGNFTGPSENTQYGPVQVQLTVANGKITAANDVQQPEDSIAANAVSQLNSEVLTAQSANIQAVSGATYTSNGYIASLQQAVDQAGL